MTLLNRRGFVMAGAAAGSALALAGCSWTPRNASSGSQQVASSAQGSAQANSSSSAAATESAPAINDELALVKGGTFTMGSPADEPWRSDDEMQHEVSVSDFYLSPTEVSRLEYNTLMGLGGATDGVPIANVTWHDAIAYCNALSAEAGREPAYTVNGEDVTWNRAANGYRLPTEAEWEFACRAGTTGPFNLDHSISADEANYYGHYPYEIEGNYFDQDVLDVKPGVYRGEPIASASFAPNAWGFCDMHGNVAEWVWDYYGAYDAGSSQDPTGPDTGSLRVNRGGGGLGQSVTAISKLAPSAHVSQGLSIYYSGGSDMPQQVSDWLAS